MFPKAHSVTHEFVKSYVLLLKVDITLRIFGFQRIYFTVRRTQPRAISEAQRTGHARLCHAMDLACVFYPKRVMCFQRSIATVLLLRSYGWPADFVHGCDISTF